MVGPLGVLEARTGNDHPEVEDVDGGALGVLELEIRECGTFRARPSGRVVNGCRNLGTNVERVVRTHFTLTQFGYFC
jgi:hypothetical protein